MSKTDFNSLAEIQQELKILRLRKEINVELLKSSKDDIEHYFQPMTLAHKIISPVKKIVIAYLLKKVFK
ncbi:MULTISPECIES: hypothetical protein [Flavobacteriaceae]|uniref:hypothetical protein n=1 Tax=Flavobacteriaceae TaxID=49546 RepID=UPI0010AE792F|nr:MULTISPECIES: hypothetical protein [Flavobacteriaceae]NJB37707.1 hypothetical protein [Croceivirga sp. JEA036]TKD62539.1 hypothetical protein FBT53_09905 [Flavobacterium sp. ASW18X]